MATTTRWTVADVEALFPEPLDDTRYEIIDGELWVSKQPSYNHQSVCTELLYALTGWSHETGLGRAVMAPGVIFAEDDAVAPDLVWTSVGRMPQVLGSNGKFHGAPDLIVEALSPGERNERRDRDVKLHLYEHRGVQEYWLVDWRTRTIDVWRRTGDLLVQVAVFAEGDTITSPLLPGFACPIVDVFGGLM